MTLVTEDARQDSKASGNIYLLLTKLIHENRSVLKSKNLIND